MAIDELNAAGGVLGRTGRAAGARRPLRSAGVSAEQAEKLIVDDKVCTVFGCWTSASRKTVVPIFERHDHLLVYPVQYEGLEQSPNVVYLGATPNQQIIPAVKWAFAFRGKRRFFHRRFRLRLSAGRQRRSCTTCSTKLGGELVGEEYLPLGSYDVKPRGGQDPRGHARRDS